MQGGTFVGELSLVRVKCWGGPIWPFLGPLPTWIWLAGTCPGGCSPSAQCPPSPRWPPAAGSRWGSGPGSSQLSRSPGHQPQNVCFSFGTFVIVTNCFVVLVVKHLKGLDHLVVKLCGQDLLASLVLALRIKGLHGFKLCNKPSDSVLRCSGWVVIPT